MIPTTTGAAKAVGLVLPELKGKLDGSAIRVPTPNVSVVDLKFVAKRATTKEEINEAIKAAADGPLKGILGYTDKPNVSIDFNHDPRSSIFHLDQTKVIDGTFVRILRWYDNEWGFSNRMADTAIALGKTHLTKSARSPETTRRRAAPAAAEGRIDPNELHFEGSDHDRHSARSTTPTYAASACCCASTSTFPPRTARSPTRRASSASPRRSPRSPTRAAR